MCCDQQYQRSFEDQQLCHKQCYINQGFSLLIQLEGEVHRKLNSFVENQVAENISTCTSQENYKLSLHQLFQDIIKI